MADKKISTELSVSVKGREAVAGLADDIDNIGDAAQRSSTDLGTLTAAETAAEASARELGVGAQAVSRSLGDVVRSTSQAGSELDELRKAIDLKTQAIKAGLQVEQSEIELRRQHLDATRAEQQALLQVAQAKGDEAAATRAGNALRQIEAEQLVLVARAKRAEAAAVQQAADARREELAAIGPLTQAQANELRATENYARALRVEAAAADQAAARSRDLTNAHKSNAAATDQLGARVQGLSQLLGQMAGALGAAFTFREMVTAAAQMEQLRSGLTAVTQDAAKAGEELEFVRTVANRIGADVAEVGKAFLGLAASTRGTAVEGEPTRQVFEAVATAMGKAGKSSADTANALLALSQMASKGVVQSEELRGQLGEALPGALNAAAKGLGITTAELMKLVEEGKITAEDLFPALAKGLNDLYGGAPGAQTLSQEITNIKNAFTDMASRIGDAGGLDALKKGAETAQTSIVLLEDALITTGKTIGVLVGALSTMDFSGAEQAFAAIEAESRDKLLKAAQHNGVLRDYIGMVGNEALKTALAQQQAGAVTTAAGAAAGAAAGDWIRLNNGYRLVLESVREQIAEAEKSVIARDAEGKAAVALAQAFGTEKEQRDAQAKATEANAQALAQVAQQRLTELTTLQAQLESLKAEGDAQGKLSEERKKQLAELEKLIALRKQETDKAIAQASASKIAAEHARAEALTHADNSARLAELTGAYLQAEAKVLQLRAAREAGKATAQQVAKAEEEARMATLLYRDALSDSMQATRADTALKRSAIGVRQSALQLAIAEKQTAYEIAKAQGDEAGAAQALVDIKRLEAKQALLAAQAKRVEAEGALSLAEAKKAELASLGLLTPVKQAEIDASINSAKAMLNQAKAAEELAKKLERLAGLRGGGGGAGETLQNVGDSADKAGDSLKDMGDKAEKAGKQTADAAKESSQSADSLVSMWWRGENGASKYAQAVNKAMWETVRFHPQTEAGFAAMSAQANKMIETLEGIDAAQQKLQQSAQGSDAALEDLRMRLLEIDGTEEEIAAAKAERERNQITLELQRLQLEMERARVWKDNAKLAELDKEIAKQKEMLALLGQIEEKERAQRKKESDKQQAQEKERTKSNTSSSAGPSATPPSSGPSTAPPASAPGASPDSSPGVKPGAGSTVYVSNITIDGRRQSVGYADRQSQLNGDALIRSLAEAKRVAQ